MGQAVVVLKKGEGRTLKAGGMWVYDNEIASVTGSYEDGDMVIVRDLMVILWAVVLSIVIPRSGFRLMTRQVNQEIERSCLRERLQAAWDYRKKVTDVSSCRLVFGEADFLPGLVVDKFSDVLVVQVTALGMDRMKLEIVDLLKEILMADGIEIKGVYERSDGKYRDQEGMERIKDFIGEPFDTDVPIMENGVRYIVDVKDGQKTGFFLDQKYNRLAIQKLCRGARVLDCFTHTGSFALNAGIAGAAEVTGVDASELAVHQAEENAVLNQLQDTVHFQCADVFNLLPELEKQGEKYDVVILDPPAFTKSRNSVKHAMKGYREINMRGMKLVKDGGFLATCSCSHFMTYELFTEMLHQAARSVHKRLRQIEYRTQAADHPILWSADESYYLKFYIFQVVDEK